MNLSTDFPLKRYALFEYETFYPGGGMADFIGSTDDLDQALARNKARKLDWCQIIDMTTGEDLAPL